MVPLVFVLYFLLWTLVLSIFPVLGVSSQIENLFTGKYDLFFAGLLHYAIYFVPISLVFSFVSIFLYIVRHPTFIFLTIPVVLTLAFASLFFIIPFSYKGMQYIARYDPELPSNTKSETFKDVTNSPLPSSGIIHGDSYFRFVWFSPKNDPFSGGPLIVVNSESRQVYPVLSVFQDVKYSPLNRILTADGVQRTRPLPGPDSHLIEMLQRPSFLNSVIIDMNSTVETLKTYWKRGHIDYLLNVGSLFFLILSFSSITYFTGWMLLNGLLSFVVLRLSFKLYPLLCAGSFYDELSKSVLSFLPPFLITPVLCVSISIVFFMLGLISLLTHKSKKNGTEISYE